MAIATTAMRNALSDAYKAQATHMALSTTVPGASAGTEVSGGTYARKPISWGASSNGSVTAPAVVFDVPSGVTVAGVMFYSALTGGTYLDGVGVTSQPFATAGTYQVTPTFTVT